MGTGTEPRSTAAPKRWLTGHAKELHPFLHPDKGVQEKNTLNLANPLKILDSDERIQGNPRYSKAQISAKDSQVRRNPRISKLKPFRDGRQRPCLRSLRPRTTPGARRRMAKSPFQRLRAIEAAGRKVRGRVYSTTTARVRPATRLARPRVLAACFAARTCTSSTGKPIKDAAICARCAGSSARRFMRRP